jgi:hypothetical protein
MKIVKVSINVYYDIILNKLNTQNWVGYFNEEPTLEELETAVCKEEFCSRCDWYDQESKCCKGCGCKAKSKDDSMKYIGHILTVIRKAKPVKCSKSKKSKCAMCDSLLHWCTQVFVAGTRIGIIEYEYIDVL